MVPTVRASLAPPPMNHHGTCYLLCVGLYLIARVADRGNLLDDQGRADDVGHRAQDPHPVAGRAHEESQGVEP